MAARSSPFAPTWGRAKIFKRSRSKALQTGASKVVIGDLREEFVKDYVFPMLRANAVYEGSYLLGTSIARPLIAKGQIDVAVQRKSRRGFPWRHRQGQRSGALRADLLCAQTGHQSHRALARVESKRALDLDRLCAQAWHSRCR